jgi:4-hydroxy-tetrahydrodipicolinate synthase
MRYSGIMTALITPLTAEGKVDEAGLRTLVEMQIDAGVHSLLVLGGTGEFTALSPDARAVAIRTVVQQTADRVPVVAGVLSPGLGDAIDAGLVAGAAGVDAVMVVTPFYVHPVQDGLVDYYRAFARAVDLPLFLYNIPYKTGVNLLPATVERIVDEVPAVVGIKECSPDIGQFLELLRRVGERTTVLSGEEFLAPSEIVLGAHGAIMASANLVPTLWPRIYRHIQAGEVGEAVGLARQHLPLFQAIFAEGNPGPLKAGMAMLGMPAGPASTPLVEVSPATRSLLYSSLTALGYVALI